VRLAMASELRDISRRMGVGVVDHLFCRAYYAVPESLYSSAPEAAVVAVPAGGDRGFQLEIHMPSDDLFVQSEYSTWVPARTRQYAAMVRSFGAVEPRDANHIELGTTDERGDYTVAWAKRRRGDRCTSSRRRDGYA
jgi:hypothetical protein